MLDNPITSTPGPPRSSLRQSLLRKTIHREEFCNDDDAERSSLVASERVASSTPASTGSNRDKSISLTPQKEHYQGCLKLFAENKITKDNAWSLQLIDFMTSMLRRSDQRMSNLQTASTVMDASARIYSLRVDAVHHDAMLMAGGLTKVAQSKRGKKDNENADEDAAGERDAAPLAAAARKKKRMRGATAGAGADLLRGDFDADLCIDPFFERLAATTGDVTSSNRAFNATLPVHDRTLALVLRTDLEFVECGEEEGEGAAGAGAGGARVALPARLLPAFSAQDRVCRPFTGFSISEWDPSAEDSAALDLSQQAVAFDVDADVEPVPETETHDPYEEEPLGGIESSEEGDVAVAACVARAAAPAPALLACMRPAAPRDARLEYAYCAVRAWAGPAHWRLKHNRGSKAPERSQAAGEPARRAARARRSPDFLAAGLAAGAAPPPDYEPAPPAKIMISRKTLATGPAWNENNYRTPVDRGLDESFFRKLFLRRRAWPPRRRAEPAPEPERLAPEEARPYDYDNENDASYCALNVEDGSAWALEGGAGGEARAGGQLHAQPAPLGDADMLEPPAKIAKIFIPYALRAKRVDMKQMKREAWRALAEGGASSLGGVVRALGGRLGGEARAALSVPLALLAVLHLANERGLRLRSRPDLRDVDVCDGPVPR